MSEIIDVKREMLALKAENERLVKFASAPKEQTVDQLGIVQQVAGIVAGYMALRDEKAKNEDKIFQLNQDNSRLQKNVKDLLAQIDVLKAKAAP